MKINHATSYARELLAQHLDIHISTMLHSLTMAQVNMHVKPIPFIAAVQNVSSNGWYLPVFWGDKTATITQHLANEFRSTVSYDIVLLHVIVGRVNCFYLFTSFFFSFRFFVRIYN